MNPRTGTKPATEITLFLLVVALLILACSSAKAGDDEARLEGYWRIGDEFVEDYRFCWFEVSSNKLTMLLDQALTLEDGIALLHGQFGLELLSDRSPKQFQTTFKGVRVRGIYELRGDSLHFEFGNDPRVPPKEFGRDAAGHQIQLHRVPTAYAQRVERLQGGWNCKIQSGTFKGLTCKTLISGERIYSRLGDHSGVGGFRLDPDPISNAVDFFTLERRKGEQQAILILDGDRLRVCSNLDGVDSRKRKPRPTDFEPDEGEVLLTLTRMNQAELFSFRLAIARDIHPFSSRKLAIQRLIEHYAGRKMAKSAEDALGKMPGEMLLQAQEFGRLRPRKAEAILRELIAIFPDSEAAATAKRSLETRREAQAMSKLKIAKMLMPEKPKAAKQWLQRIVDNYDGTTAAEEAKVLLKEL